MLLFKKKFLDAIRCGEKTQTIRLWKHRMMKTGQRSYIPGVGYIHVALVEQVELSDLTDKDARPDGFETADLLRAEIKKIYAADQTGTHQAYRICFSVMSSQEQEKIRTEKGKGSK